MYQNISFKMFLVDFLIIIYIYLKEEYLLFIFLYYCIDVSLPRRKFNEENFFVSPNCFTYNAIDERFSVRCVLISAGKGGRGLGEMNGRRNRKCERN